MNKSITRIVKMDDWFCDVKMVRAKNYAYPIQPSQN